MKEVLRKIAIVGGFLSFAIPIGMLFLWNSYISEQTQLSEQISREICEPYAFEVGRVNEKLEFSWQTEGECSGFLLLGSTYSDFSNLPYKVLSSDGELPTKSHSVVIQKQDEISYRYGIIVSEGEWFGIHGSPFLIKQED